MALTMFWWAGGTDAITSAVRCGSAAMVAVTLYPAGRFGGWFAATL